MISRACRSIPTQISATSGMSTSPARAVNDENAAFHRPVDIHHPAERLVRRIANLAADEVVMVERARGQRGQRRRRHFQLGARQRLGVVHRLDALERDDRPALMKPDLANPPRRRFGAHEQNRSGPESILGEVGVEVDDYLPAIAVRPGDTADEEEIATIGAALVIRHP